MAARDDSQTPAKGRSARKREAILDAATRLFLRDGYRGTNMERIAADAAVSKQTVYKHFDDKEHLFRAIVNGVTANSEAIVAELTSALDEGKVGSVADLRGALEELADRYIELVLQTHVLSLRRLVIAEAERFPDLARAYYEQAPARAIEVIAATFRNFTDRGLLATPDPEFAAAHFAYLTLGIPQDKALFLPGERPSSSQRERLSREAVRVFLAGYRSPG